MGYSDCKVHAGLSQAAEAIRLILGPALPAVELHMKTAKENRGKLGTRHVFLFGISLVLGILIPLYGATTPPLPQSAAAANALGEAFAAISEQTRGCVVSVLSEKFIQTRPELPLPFEDPFFHQFFGNPQNQQPQSRKIPIAGLGSGFILDEKGHVLTNDHVVHGMEKIHVVFPDKRSYEAKVLGSDPKTDIAVLRIQGTVPKGLTAARLGDSDTLKAGHLVLAFGAPFGLTQTVTSGIISATGRSDVGIADFEDFIQTDAPINPGNSGGPLVNMKGEVIGMNTAIATSIGQSAGVGFAIPINMAKDLLPTLLQGKKIQRGMLGVGVQDVTPALEKQFHLPSTQGALVSQVSAGSPAEKAGLKAGDVIVKFAGKPIETSAQLREQVAKRAPGSKEEIVVLRDGKNVPLTATLGQSGVPPAEPAVATGAPLEKFGLEIRDLSPEIRAEFNVKEKQGVLVTDVEPASSAGMAGIRPGDVITEVDRKKVDNVNKATEILAKAGGSKEVLLLVDHKGSTFYVTLETG